MQLQAILKALNPFAADGVNILYGLMLYLIIILIAVGMFMQKIPDTSVTLLLSATILFCLVDKVANPRIFNPPIFLFLMRVMMFVFPTLVTGISKSPKSRLPLLSGAFIAFCYAILRGFVDMNFGDKTAGPAVH